MSSSSVATRRSDAEASRARILGAARALFSAHGSSEVTMADVAARAGVSRATVFNHFGSKHALVEAVTEGVFLGYESILERALAERGTPVPVLLRALFLVMGRGIEQDPGFYRTVFREISRVTLGLEEGGVAQRARRRSLDCLVHLLTRGQARGELRADLDAERMAGAFDSLVFGTITQWLYDDACGSLTERMVTAVRIFLEPAATAKALGDETLEHEPEPELWLGEDPAFGPVEPAQEDS